MGKQFVKNITDDPKEGYSPVTLSYNELGQRFILKPGESKETKLHGENLDGNRLRLVDNDKKKSQKVACMYQEVIMLLAIWKFVKMVNLLYPLILGFGDIARKGKDIIKAKDVK